MDRDKPEEYGGRDHEVVTYLFGPADDEEAQLLNSEDYEQFELDDTSRPVPRTQQQADPERGQPRPGRARRRRLRPRWLAFLYGPDPPKVHAIEPYLPWLQELPRKWLERTFPHRWQRIALLILFLFAWTQSLIVPLVLSKGTATDASGNVIRHIDCVDTLWRRNNECGLDGISCRPFTNKSFAFRCPADCAGVRVLNPHHVGREDINYRPLVIGGGEGSPYRGDSFLCGAAIHAGVVDDTTGGCGVITLTGEYYRYFSSSQHGIDSIPFDSYFPLSFNVTPDPSIHCTAPDPRWTVSLPLSVLFSVLLAVFATSPPLLFFATFIGIFTHVALVSDPPNTSTPSSAALLPTLVSLYAGRLLPALFIAAILYLTTVRRTLSPPPPPPSKPPAPQRAPSPPPLSLETPLLFTLPFWLGALTNRTLEPLIPIARLTPADILSGQPGALLALILLTALVLAIAVIQARTLYLESRLPRYLALYLLFLLVLLSLAALTTTTFANLHLHLRVHHYLLALLLLPGTATRTRLGLACQALLLGLFANGVARWGFASVLETADALRGDGGFGGAVLPEVVAPLVERLGGGAAAAAATAANATAAAAAAAGAAAAGSGGSGDDGGGRGGGAGMRIWFKWKGMGGEEESALAVAGRRVEGISVLVNDVERFRGWFAETRLEDMVFAWTRTAGMVVDEYFRFGFVTEGGEALDYTEAGTWFANGTWSQGEGYY